MDSIRPLSAIDEKEPEYKTENLIQNRKTVASVYQSCPRPNNIRRDSDLNLEKNQKTFLTRRKSSVANINKISEHQSQVGGSFLQRRLSTRKSISERRDSMMKSSRSGSIFSKAETEYSQRTSIIGGRRNVAGEKFKSLIRHHVMPNRTSTASSAYGDMNSIVLEVQVLSRFRKLIRNHVLSRLNGADRTFSGLPISFYVPEHETQTRKVMENSYRTKPNRIFKPSHVIPQIQKAVDTFIGKYYICSDAKQSVQHMCENVKEELKRFNYRRYRFVVSGYIVENAGQDVKIVSRSLIDEKYDKFFTCSTQNSTNTVVCTVHAIYML